ncbi:hypothetical protein D9M68_641080 [compost metagenome]
MTLSLRVSEPISWRVISPKLTSVPMAMRVAATFWSAWRPFIASGTHCLICSGSSEYSMPRNSELCCRAAWRFLRKAMLSSPQTKLMCGTLLMKDFGLLSTLRSTW